MVDTVSTTMGACTAHHKYDHPMDGFVFSEGQMLPMSLQKADDSTVDKAACLLFMYSEKKHLRNFVTGIEFAG